MSQVKLVSQRKQHDFGQPQRSCLSNGRAPLVRIHGGACCCSVSTGCDITASSEMKLVWAPCHSRCRLSIHIDRVRPIGLPTEHNQTDYPHPSDDRIVQSIHPSRAKHRQLHLIGLSRRLGGLRASPWRQNEALLV